MSIFGIFRKKKKGILEEDPVPSKRMGSPDLESAMDRRVPVIFPTRSPISSLAGPPEETKTPPDEDFMPRYSGKFMSRLMEARKDLNKVYSEGYFENHYPEADKSLKQFLHERALASWAKALREKPEPEHEEEEHEEKQQVTVVINLNK